MNYIINIDIWQYLMGWGMLGLFACYVIPEIEWKRKSTKYLFIFALGPMVWAIGFVTLFLDWAAFKVIEKHTGLKKDDWTEKL